MDEDYHQAIAHTARILDAWLPHKIQYDRIPSLSVGIVHSGRPVYQRGFGFADVESKTPATARTCYRIASISKTFTAVAIMQLVEQGKIGLDDRVRLNRYAPSEPGSRINNRARMNTGRKRDWFWRESYHDLLERLRWI